MTRVVWDVRATGAAAATDAVWEAGAGALPITAARMPAKPSVVAAKAIRRIRASRRNRSPGARNPIAPSGSVRFRARTALCSMVSRSLVVIVVLMVTVVVVVIVMIVIIVIIVVVVIVVIPIIVVVVIRVRVALGRICRF